MVLVAKSNKITNNNISISLFFTVIEKSAAKVGTIMEVKKQKGWKSFGTMQPHPIH